LLYAYKSTPRTKYGTLGSGKESLNIYKIFFYRTVSGREPVREWLRQIDPVDRKRIGEDLYTLQLGWPAGMPLARKLEPNLWEFRCRISNGIVRIMFTEEKDALILLHGFIKKSQKLPANELALAKERLATFRVKR
jgi:phage-related protein